MNKKYQVYKFHCSSCNKNFEVLVSSAAQTVNVTHSCGMEAKCVANYKQVSTIPVPLKSNDFERIYKWYDKGFTNVKDDRPLLDKFKEYHLKD